VYVSRHKQLPCVGNALLHSNSTVVRGLSISPVGDCPLTPPSLLLLVLLINPFFSSLPVSLFALADGQRETNNRRCRLLFEVLEALVKVWGAFAEAEAEE
jgi:hypothetical protein